MDCTVTIAGPSATAVYFFPTLGDAGSCSGESSTNECCHTVQGPIGGCERQGDATGDTIRVDFEGDAANALVAYLGSSSYDVTLACGPHEPGANSTVYFTAHETAGGLCGT
jgi:hypothetical protein